jgi:membrane protease YdiL (CAAX protease family)
VNSESSERPLPTTGDYGKALFAVFLALLPWGAVWFGLHKNNSAPLAFVCYHALCLIGGLLLRSPGLPRTERVSPMRRRILVGVVLLANVGAAILYTLVGSLLLDRLRVLERMEVSGLPPTSYLYLFPYFAIVNPLAEEFFWRGGVYAALRRVTPHWTWAAGISSLFFGAWHWLVIMLFVEPWVALTATVSIALVGFLLALIYERTSRLIYPIVFHALAGDLPLLVILALVTRSPEQAILPG